MRSPMFSILVVSLNPGDRLAATVKSVAEQSCRDYEVVVKDGGSRDGSLEALREYLAAQPRLAQSQGLEEEETPAQGQVFGEEGAEPVVRILEQADTGIYDGMNQATRAARGEYLYFLNCGDVFASETALEQAARWIKDVSEAEPGIFYGDIFDALRQQVVASNPHIDAFACYRNVPNHQACIYHHSLFEERGYETGYRVRADYEHFLWCFFKKNVSPKYIPVTLASYEGGGFSETAENRKRSAGEHKEITGRYLSRGQLFRYRMILLLTLQPLRTKMSESPALAGVYNKCKRLLYRKGR